jgi:uncharacterized protein (DUF924 family)
MTKRQIRVIDGNTVIDREMTAKEIAAYDAAMSDIEQDKLDQADKAKAKQIVLDRLGITADEAALLLG